MMKVHFNNLSLFLIIFLYSQSALALTPPTKDHTLCYVEGEVLSHQKKEASDVLMNTLEVDTITLIMQAVSPIDKNYKGSFCERMTGQLTEKKIITFRLCDETDANEGKIIKGIIGKSLGGGPYCIESIQVLNNDTIVQ